MKKLKLSVETGQVHAVTFSTAKANGPEIVMCCPYMMFLSIEWGG